MDRPFDVAELIGRRVDIEPADFDPEQLRHAHRIGPSSLASAEVADHTTGIPATA